MGTAQTKTGTQGENPQPCSFTDWLLDILLPAHCVLCGLAGESSGLCQPCQEDLPTLLHGCRQCALPGVTAAPWLCGRCLCQAPCWDLAVAALTYEYPVDHLVRKFKFQRRRDCGQVLAEQLAQAVLASANPVPDLLIPVPLHYRRLFSRGFNQAEFIARHVGRRLGCRVHPSLLQRIRPTAAQSGLPGRQRRSNVRGAFRCKPLDGLHVALVDDVLTTGTTAGECAATIKAAGAAMVSVWVTARVPAPSGSQRTKL